MIGDHNVEETIICSSCITENDRHTVFCSHCGCPIGQTSTLDPMNTIQSQGYLLRTATYGRPKLIAIVGIWLLFLPTGLIGLIFLVGLIKKNDFFSSSSYRFIALVMASQILLSFTIIYHSTKNYVIKLRAKN